MNLRIWIPCILLIVILIMLVKTYFVEGFQSGSGSAATLSENDTRMLFWSILNQEKAGSSSGSGHGSRKELLSQVMNPKENDTFKLVYPKYISMYALAKYNNNPIAARSALLNDFDKMQAGLEKEVELETEKRSAFAANPQSESCKILNTLTMALYGKLLSIQAGAQDISGNGVLAQELHAENLKLQNASACMNQGATPSAACIALARLDEKLFPLLPIYENANISLLTNAQSIQETIDLLLQAYQGMGCLPVGGSAAGSGPLSISSVFSSEYVNNLPIVDTRALIDALEQLSPYYVSTNIINFISGRLIGTPDFKSKIATTSDYISNMAKTTNNIVNLNSVLGAGEFFNESGAGPLGIANCPPGYYCPPTSTMPIQCPVGTYCPAGTTDAPIPCPDSMRRFSPLGASSEGECISTAPAGYYIDPAKNLVIECPTGAFCMGGKKFDCSGGTYNMKKGMASSLSCLPCPKGAYCPSPTSVISCDIGKYNPTLKAKDKSACIPCTVGHYCPQKGVVEPFPCLAGTYSPSTGAGVSCTPVAAGYYLPSTGSVTDVLKIPCTAGYYCPSGTGNQQLCPLGSYCPEPGPGSGSGSGSGSFLSGPPGPTRAVPCPGGTYGSVGGLTSSTCSGKCAAGYVCPPGSTSPTVTSCPSGYYCPTGSAAGTPCPAGHYCPVGSADKTPCPPNTYNPMGEMTSINACSPCPDGKNCPNPGTVTPNPCPVGYYCTRGTDATPCPAGSVCTQTGLSAPGTTAGTSSSGSGSGSGSGSRSWFGSGSRSGSV